MWPYCTQPLYYGSMPVIVNTTILNGLGVSGKIINKPTWHPYTPQNGHLLDIAISYSEILWPWSGWLAVHISVSKAGATYEGLAHGHISVTVESPAGLGEIEPRQSTVELPIRLVVVYNAIKRIKVSKYRNLLKIKDYTGCLPSIASNNSSEVEHFRTMCFYLLKIFSITQGEL